MKQITRKYLKGYRIFSFARNLSNRYWKQLLYIATKTGLDALKTDSRKLVHKVAEATDEFIGNDIAEILKIKPLPPENPRNDEEVVIPIEKAQEKLNKLSQYYKTEHQKIVIKWFSYVKVSVKKIDWSKLFIWL